MIALPAEFPAETRPLHGGWVLSCEHSASSYGLPVLVSPEGKAFGPGDLLSMVDVAAMRGIGQKTLSAYLNRRQPSAGPGWLRVGTGGGWAIFAADAVRP